MSKPEAPFSEWCEDLKEFCWQTIGILYQDGTEFPPGTLICGDGLYEYWLEYEGGEQTSIDCYKIKEVYAQT